MIKESLAISREFEWKVSLLMLVLMAGIGARAYQGIVADELSVFQYVFIVLGFVCCSIGFVVSLKKLTVTVDRGTNTLIYHSISLTRVVRRELSRNDIKQLVLELTNSAGEGGSSTHAIKVVLVTPGESLPLSLGYSFDINAVLHSAKSLADMLSLNADDVIEQSVLYLLQQKRKLHAIALLRICQGLSVEDAVEYVDQISIADRSNVLAK